MVLLHIVVRMEESYILHKLNNIAPTNCSEINIDA